MLWLISVASINIRMKTGTAVGSALTADGIKNTVIGLGLTMGSKQTIKR